MGIEYIDYEQALKIYAKTVEKSGGGLAGVRDVGGIQLVLDMVQNDVYYPEIADKAAYMMFSLCRGHYFEDCNKRISITLTMYFLLQNGYLLAAQSFMKDTEELVLDLAAGCLEKEVLTAIIQSLIDGTEYEEWVKVAINNGRERRLEIEKQFKD